MHAFLFVGGTSLIRQEALKRKLSDWHIVPADIVNIELDGEHITIDAVRGFQKRLLLTPMQSPHTAGVIENAHLLTTEAQQALLKLLEEPPPHAYILCETETVDQLLPTIVSRCQVIGVSEDKPSSTELESITQTLMTLLQASPGEVLAQVDIHTNDRIESKAWTRELLTGARALLLSHYQKGRSSDSKKLVTLIRRLQLAQAQLSVNCNPKLVLDRVFLSL